MVKYGLGLIGILAIRRQKLLLEVRVLAQVVFCLLLSVIPAGAQEMGQRAIQSGFTAFEIDLASYDLELNWKKQDGSRFSSLESLIRWKEQRGKSVAFATNAGIFGLNFSPLGLHVESGKTLAPLNTRSGHGNFYMKPNGVFGVRNGKAFIVSTASYKHDAEVLMATQSGPMLVENGTLHPKFRLGSHNRFQRSGVGVQEDGRVIFIISDHQVNFYDFATLFRDKYKCPNALYLDGVISKVFAPAHGRKQMGGGFVGIISASLKTKK